MKLSHAVHLLLNYAPHGPDMLRAIAPFGFVTDAETDEELCVATRAQLSAFFDAEVAAHPAGPPRGCLDVDSWGGLGATSYKGATIEVGGRACFLADVRGRPLVRQHRGPPRAGMVETGDEDETSLWVGAGPAGY